MIWGNSPSDSRLDVFGIYTNNIVEFCVRIGGKGFPLFDGLLPVIAGGRVRAVLQKLKSSLVRVNVTAAGSAFDGHIADCHALLHGEVVESGA